MVKASPRFTFSLITPQGILIDKISITMAICPGEEGDLGILAGHTPLITPLRAGILSLWDGSEKIFSLSLYDEFQGLLSVQSHEALLTLDQFCTVCYDTTIEGISHLSPTLRMACAQCGHIKINREDLAA